MSSSSVLDAERLASFKTSLVSLREAMKQRQYVRTSGGGTADNNTPSAAPPSSPSQPGHGSSPPSPRSFPAGSGGGINNPPSRKSKPQVLSFLGWLNSEKESILWILACAALGAFLGFAVGCGWLTRGAGNYQYFSSGKRILGAMSAKTGFSRRKAVRAFVVSPWRAALAKRIRGTVIYQLFTLKKTPWRILFDFGYSLVFSQKTTPNQHWIAASPLWPPNWILFREVDLSQIDVGEGGLSPMMISSLSFVLPWRRTLIRALERKDRVKVNLRDQDGNTIHPSVPSPSSFSSSLLSSATQSAHPINPYYHPMAFHTLREYIIRFENGYVHPDLGFLVPAPSGEIRMLTQTVCI